MNVTVMPRTIASGPADFVSPPQLFLLVRRRAWLIGLCAVAGAAASFAITHSMPRTYTADAMLSVDSERFLIPQLQGAAGTSADSSDPMPALRTEAEALTSRQLVQSVIDTLHLDRYPEFNPALRPPSVVAKVTGWFRSLMPSGPVLNVQGARDEAVLTAVTKELDVAVGKLSISINISFVSEDPKLAALVVNTLVKQYIGSLESERQSFDRGASATLNDKLAKVSSEIAGFQQRMSELRASSKFVGLRAGSVGQQQLEDLATAATQASVDRAQVEATWQRASALTRGGDPEALANVLSSTTIGQLRQQEVSGMQRVADLSQRYGANYPGVQAAQADVAVARRQVTEEAQRIVASLSTQLSVARAREVETKRQLDAARLSGVKNQDVQAQLDQLQQEIDARHTLYQSLLQGLQQSDNHSQQQNAVPEVRVISTAAPPGLPSGPNGRVAAALGLVGGGMLGMLLTLGVRRGLPAFTSVTEFTELTGLTVLASLPRSARKGNLAARTAADPRSKLSEELRVLRTRLRKSGSGGVPRSVVFTSPGHGKEAANVAAAFARLAAIDGEHVLLIEGDLRHPWLGHTLGAEQDGKLVSVLKAEADWRQHCVRDRSTPLDLLLSSNSAAVPPALMTGNMFHNLLAEVSEEYGCLVLDASSAAMTSDAIALARGVDATILVVDVTAASQALALEAVSRLTSAGTDTIVAVMVGLA